MNGSATDKMMTVLLCTTLYRRDDPSQSLQAVTFEMGDVEASEGESLIENLQLQGSSSSEVVNGEQLADETAVHNNFLVLCGCVSVAMATVLMLISLASSVFAQNAELGNLAGFSLWWTFMLCGFLVSATMTATLGPKRCIMIGLFSQCVFAASFIVAAGGASYNPDHDNSVWRGVLVVVGHIVSGFGSSLLWAAQGKYMQLSAVLLAERTGSSSTDGSLLLSLTFALCFLGCEFSTKLASALIPMDNHPLFYSIFTVTAFLATVGSSALVDLHSRWPSAEAEEIELVEGALMAYRLLAREPWRVLSVCWLPLTFGLCTIILNYDGDQKMVTDGPWGMQSIGYATSTLVGAAFASVCVMRQLTQTHETKVASIIAACACFGLWASILLIMGFKGLRCPACLLCMYGLFGIARGVYESSLRSVVSDLFPDDGEAAFSLLTTANGFAAACALLLRQFSPWRVSVSLAIALAGASAAQVARLYLKGQ